MNTSLTSASHTDKVLMNTANLLIKANLKIVELKKEKKKNYIYFYFYYFNNFYNNVAFLLRIYDLNRRAIVNLRDFSRMF
jgi:radical SAM superfamily enzyme